MKKEVIDNTPKVDISKSKAERYLIRSSGDWAYIYIEHYHTTLYNDNVGIISINSSFGNYGYSFGAVGNDFKKFLIDCDIHYLTQKISDNNNIVFDFDKTIRNFKYTLLERRGYTQYSKEQARYMYNFFNQMDPCDKDVLLEKILSNKQIEWEEPWEWLGTILDPKLRKFWEKLWLPFIEELKKEV
jgi:hypothetical protein